MQEVELQQLGSYKLTELLRTSSTSTFYRSRLRKKDFLLKKLNVPLTTTEAKGAFLARAKQLKKLKDRNIHNVVEANFVGDYAYLVMDYVEGETLRERIPAGKRIAPDEVKQYLSPIADAIHRAHVNNVMHNNLHPGNLLAGAYSTFLLTDFSLALPGIDLVLDDEDFAIPYKAPEALQGLPTFNSDQYSLAVIAYEWLCGRRPFDATERELLLQQQQSAQLPAPRSLNEAISPAVERVLLQALAYDPAERFAHTFEFSNQYLSALMGFPIKVSQPSSTRSSTISSDNQALKKDVVKDTTKKLESSLDARQDATKQDFKGKPTLEVKPSPSTSKIGNRADIKDGEESIAVSNVKCRKCEVSNRKDAKFCISCGQSLEYRKIKNRFDVIAELGGGGYGTVYRAKDEVLEREVAIKEMHQEGLVALNAVSEAEKSFKAEALILAKLNHVSIPKIYEHFSEADHHYIVMEYIKGETLEDYLKNTGSRKSGIGDTLYIGIQLCAVLNYLHNCNPPIIFRDLKPSNIMWDKEKKMLFLVDFGIARHFKQGKRKDTTQFGTPGYAAPEQFGSNQTSCRSDIYSLGALLHQMLSGNDPSQNGFQFAPLQLGNHQVYSKLSDLIVRMTAFDINGRPDNMGLVQQELQIIREQLLFVLQNSSQPAARLRLSSNQEVSYSAVTEPLNNIDATQFDAEKINAGKVVNNSGDNSRLQSIVEQDLQQGGVLSQLLPGYEERPAQIEMATLVARSLTQGVPAIAEAGTGTGKSLAYLLPIVRSGKVAIVSTANKALQEQLFYKDIPFVQQHIKPFEAALVKGVNNYVCIDRLETERVGMQFYAKNRDFKRLLDIVNDPESTFSGDFETLGFQLPGDVRSKVATDSDQCAWSKCSFFGECYVRMMRERAERAKVIVVNHTLLLLDAAMDGFLLPERDVIVLDEAHHLEEEATRSFTVTISPMQVQTLLAQRMLKDHTLLRLQDETLQAAEHMWSRLYQVANPGYKGRVNLEAPLEEGLRLATVIADLADSLRKQRPKDMPEREGQLYDKLLKRAQNLAENVRMVFSVAERDKFVYYVERVEASANRVTLQASAAPLDVTKWLKERLFNKCNVICTSATLATIGPNPARPEEKGPNFAYFRRRVGLDPLERSDVLERILPLAFDYEENALLYLPRDLPEPTYGAGSDDYMKAIAREMYRLVKLSRGRAFLLFSSKRMLDRAYELMAPHLPYPLLKQGDMTRMELTRRFRQEEGSVLFGLKSFWEGVDIAGEALSLVVIDKLPFDPPDDPVHEARVAMMKAAGENWFGTYVLPQAVLRLKQGIGRLLRTRDDRGVMAILDTRLHTKGYGKLVLNALPPARRTSSLRDVERFFSDF